MLNKLPSAKSDPLENRREKNATSFTIAHDLSPTSKYPEKELNAIIAKYHDDTAAIRRHMIEKGILEKVGGRVYWVSGTQN